MPFRVASGPTASVAANVVTPAASIPTPRIAKSNGASSGSSFAMVTAPARNPPPAGSKVTTKLRLVDGATVAGNVTPDTTNSAACVPVMPIVDTFSTALPVFWIVYVRATVPDSTKIEPKSV